MGHNLKKNDEGTSGNCYCPTVQKKVTVNGAQLHCTISGDGPYSILCIPGAAAPSQWAFASQLEYFGREGSGYTIIVYDPRGYGSSTLPEREFQVTPEHHLKTDAIDAYHLMNSLGYSEFSVLGWCDGGVSAIHLAAQFPAAIKKLVVWGSRTYLTENDVKLSEELGDLQNWSPRYLEAYTAVYGMERLSSLWQRFTKSVRATYIHTDGDVCSAEMGRVTCPSLVLHGEKDKFSTQSHAEYMNKHIAGSQLLTFANSGHNPQVCTEFNSTVDRFLKEYSCL